MLPGPFIPHGGGGVNTKSRVMSIAVCLLLIISCSAPFTQNVGQPQNAEQSQNIVQSTSSSSGTGGLADSPWPMFRQNLNHTGQSPYDTSENPGLLKWSFTTGSRVFSSPAIGIDGTIYVGSDDYKVYAINPDGTKKWNFTTGGQVGSSPAIDSECTIYVGSDDTKLYAINPDGTEKWSFTTGNIVQSSPAIGSDGTIYVGSDDAKLYAINPDGTEKWSFTTNAQVDSSPAIGSDGTIYISSQDNKLYAINPDGSEKWSFITGHIMQSSPAIDSDGTIYVGSEDKTLYAINPNGSKKWSFNTGGFIFPSPAISFDGTIYVGSYDYKLYAINPDGTEKWNFKTGWGILSSCAISSDETIYIGSTDGKLYAINPDSTEKWNFTINNVVGSSPTIGFDGTIYVGSNDGKLYAIGIPSLNVNVTSHFSELNSAAQSAITVHVTDGTNPVQGATVNLVSDNGGIFSPQSGITDANGDFECIFNAPTVTSQIICRISAEVSKTGYNDGSGYVDVTINPIPWPMFSHNNRRSSHSPYDTSSNPGKLKWSFTTGGFVMSPVIGSDETIYVGSHDNKLYAINPDGTEKWNFTIGGYMALSPTIDSDGTIYAGGLNNGLFAINPDGTEKWHAIPGSDISYSPAIGAEGTIYVPVRDYNLYAINPDGIVKWVFTTINGHVGSPAIDYDGTIYIGSSDHKLYAINPDGTEKWNTTSGDMIQAAPAIGLDGTIYVGSKDSNLYAISPNGVEIWRFTAGKAICWQSSPAIGSDGTIYVGSNDYNLYAINPNGTEKWRFSANSQIQSAPAIGSDGTIFFGSDDFNLYTINPDGSKKWHFTTGWNIHSSPAIGSDGTIYIGSIDSKLYAINEGATPPTADAGPGQTVNEGDTVQFDGSSSYDPDGTIETYEWDFDSSDGLWWETGATPDATGPTPIHIYGDDSLFIATLRVTDNDNLSATDTCNITVHNVNPTVSIEPATMKVEIGLRVAGRKYNNVNMTLFEDEDSLGSVSIERLPGSPNVQMAWIPVNIDFSKIYSANVTFTPENPPNVGANPVWIYIKSTNGTINKIHHTFNVQQSKKRDSEHWNHVEPWEVDLNGHFIGLPFEIMSHITDPGSDDETMTFTYGSQVKIVIYLNNPPNPDPYPSPEVNPIDIMDTTTLVYEGPGTVTLVVKDDDNVRLGVGEGIDSIDIG
ncbi:MAG: hypothetical protein A7315_02965 [Candidatus Altiarchaeales archaeon WOR_SM1_79]|nr:MAG: hypothetical protein A7315_02965 [Candidatus Altiarchaeales archaeon WOR_SM1_79]